MREAKEADAVNLGPDDWYAQRMEWEHEVGLSALRDEVDRDWESIWCVDCGVEVDGLGPPICRECADVDD